MIKKDFEWLCDALQTSLEALRTIEDLSKNGASMSSINIAASRAIDSALLCLKKSHEKDCAPVHVLH